MVRVVIVEDEMLVRLGVKMSLEDSGAQIKVEAACASAEDALEYFEENMADVLLTDIRLPGMDGLELIERLKKTVPGLITVVLSCYEEFSYARKAMELGVDKYVLKHELSEDELVAIIENLYEEKHIRGGNEKNERPSGRRVSEAAAGQKYRIAYIVLRKKEESHNLCTDDIDFEIAVEVLQEILNIRHNGECFLRHSQEIFCIIRFDEDKREEEMRQQTLDFYENARKSMKKYFNANLYMNVSKVFKELERSREVFEKVKKDESGSFYNESSCLSYIEDGTEKKPIRLGRSEKQILSDEWYEETVRNTENFLWEARRESVPPEDVKNEVVKFIYDLSGLLKKYYAADLEEWMGDGERTSYTYISRFDSCHSLLSYIKEILQALMDTRQKEVSEYNKIARYIDENYMRELSLKEVSEHFHMSAPYFCQYFKKYTGSTFVQYLNQVRIEKASQLLGNPELTTDEVAGLVGIFNTNYFLRLFKKMTGRTVGEYRSDPS